MAWAMRGRQRALDSKLYRQIFPETRLNDKHVVTLAVGTASNTYSLPGINSAASLAAQQGDVRFVTAHMQKVGVCSNNRRSCDGHHIPIVHHTSIKLRSSDGGPCDWCKIAATKFACVALH
jgi:hypothetical protein